MTPSTVLEADLTLLSARLSSLEKQVAQLTPSSPAPAALPVDKTPAADYALPIAAASEDEDDEEEVEVIAQPNITRLELTELADAIREYMEWNEPQPHLTEDSWKVVSSASRCRLERALTGLERELRRVADA